MCRYDPISSSLAFTSHDGSEHTVRVGDNGRLRAVLESGYVNSKEARDIGLPIPEAYKGKRNREADPGRFNPLTHQYEVGASPRDFSRSSGRNRGPMGTSLSPRLNPLTQKLDPLNCAPHGRRAATHRYEHAHPPTPLLAGPQGGASDPRVCLRVCVCDSDRCGNGGVRPTRAPPARPARGDAATRDHAWLPLRGEGVPATRSDRAARVSALGRSACHGAMSDHAAA